MKFRWRGKPKLFGFDEVFYLKQYPDLADLGIAPQEHYLTPVLALKGCSISFQGRSGVKV